jgi:hypothetical protein
MIDERLFKERLGRLTRCLENPVDTPDYVKAKEERNYRLRRYGLYVAAATTIVVAALKIFSK